jgi:putative tryptophan/tyrosine transport system substrate-binding protein
MKRRDFIATLAGTAAWPLTAYAQADRMRRIAILMGVAETEEGKAWVAAFRQRLQDLGWSAGHNASFDVRWWSGTPEEMRTAIANLLAISPDIILASSNFAVSLLKPMAQHVPIVFAHLGDPVGSGFAATLAHPGGNITGFAGFDSSMGGKWLQVLKETVPTLRSVLTLYQPETPVHQSLLRSIIESAPSLGIEAVPGAVHDGAEIEHSILSFGTIPNGGIIVLPHAITNANESLIIASALRYRLPALFSTVGAVRAGALVSYTYDLVDAFRKAAEYVDRILRGAKPGDLPIQQPTRFEITLNLKTAKAIGVEVPPMLLGRADEVIE